MATTTIPAFIAAFVSALGSPISALGAKVHDGPPLGDEHMNYVAVGYSEDTGAAVDAQQQAITLQNGREESYDVACQACALSGDNSMATARAAALALFAAVETVLRGDWRVSNTVTFAEVGSYRLSQYQTDRGAVSVVDFAVAVRITPL